MGSIEVTREEGRWEVGKREARSAADYLTRSRPKAWRIESFLSGLFNAPLLFEGGPMTWNGELRGAAALSECYAKVWRFLRLFFAGARLRRPGMFWSTSWTICIQFFQVRLLRVSLRDFAVLGFKSLDASAKVWNLDFL